jgi:hypothetical protein
MSQAKQIIDELRELLDISKSNTPCFWSGSGSIPAIYIRDINIKLDALEQKYCNSQENLVGSKEPKFKRGDIVTLKTGNNLPWRITDIHISDGILYNGVYDGIETILTRDSTFIHVAESELQHYKPQENLGSSNEKKGVYACSECGHPHLLEDLIYFEGNGKVCDEL